MTGGGSRGVQVLQAPPSSAILPSWLCFPELLPPFALDLPSPRPPPSVSVLSPSPGPARFPRGLPLVPIFRPSQAPDLSALPLPPLPPPFPHLPAPETSEAPRPSPPRGPCPVLCLPPFHLLPSSFPPPTFRSGLQYFSAFALQMAPPGLRWGAPPPSLPSRAGQARLPSSTSSSFLARPRSLCLFSLPLPPLHPPLPPQPSPPPQALPRFSSPSLPPLLSSPSLSPSAPSRAASPLRRLSPTHSPPSSVFRSISALSNCSKSCRCVRNWGAEAGNRARREGKVGRAAQRPEEGGENWQEKLEKEGSEERKGKEGGGKGPDQRTRGALSGRPEQVSDGRRAAPPPPNPAAARCGEAPSPSIKAGGHNAEEAPGPAAAPPPPAAGLTDPGSASLRGPPLAGHAVPGRSPASSL